MVDDGESAIRKRKFFEVGRCPARWFAADPAVNCDGVAPGLSLGDWDATDLNGMPTAFSQSIGSGVLSPQEPMIRERLGMPPMNDGADSTA